MFHVGDTKVSRGFRGAIAGLALLSLMALVVTAWILSDFRHEQEIVQEMTRHLPVSERDEAGELVGEMRLHARLSILLILNIIVTACAVTMLVRAYVSSERSLREVKVLATDILASMDQGVITTDRDRNILSINPCGRRILNRTDDGTGVALRDLPEQHRTLDEICREVLEHPGGASDRDYVAVNNGHTRTLRAGCSLLRDVNGRHLGTVLQVRDVTEKTLMEQRLRRMERYMGLGSLAAGLQHEIKNPLSALSLHVQLLDEALRDQESPSEVREMLDVLNTEVRRITGVLESFRDFASVSQLCRSEVDPTQWIEKLVRLIEPQARRQQVRVETQCPPLPAPSILADSGRMEQVLLNLVVNALDAMPEGGVLRIGLEVTPDAIRIEVGDTGCGIADDFKDRIFDPYFTTRSTGTGMGLALSEKFVRQHDGTIDFSTGPEGTVFTVSLPRIETT